MACCFEFYPFSVAIGLPCYFCYLKVRFLDVIIHYFILNFELGVNCLVDVCRFVSPLHSPLSCMKLFKTKAVHGAYRLLTSMCTLCIPLVLCTKVDMDIICLLGHRQSDKRLLTRQGRWFLAGPSRRFPTWLRRRFLAGVC
jgi:hypothetical protein